MKNDFLDKFFTLKEEEKCQYQSFLQSNFLNDKPELLVLYEFLNENASETWTKELIFKTIFPQKKYDDTLFRWFMSYAHQSVEQFLYIQKLKKQTLQKDLVGMGLVLLEEYLDKSQFSFYEKKEKQVIKALQETKRNIHYYAQWVDFEIRRFEYLSITSTRQEKTNLIDLSAAIDRDFIYKKLKYGCDARNRQNIFQDQSDFTFLDHLLSLESIIKYTTEDLGIKLYYHIYLLLKEKKEADYFTIKQLLFENIHQIETKELNDLYGYLQNFCIQAINTGNSIYSDELFSLYNTLIEHKIILRNGAFYLFDFKNISTLALRLHKTDWMEQFTLQYQAYLPLEHQESATKFNLARIAFIKKEYKASLRSLNNVHFSDVYYDLGGRVLIAKCYFELDDFPLLETVLGSFKIFIKRNKSISDYQKELYENFIKTLLYLSKNIHKPKKIEVLKTRVSDIKSITERAWLNDKMEQVI